MLIFWGENMIFEGFSPFSFTSILLHIWLNPWGMWVVGIAKTVVSSHSNSFFFSAGMIFRPSQPIFSEL